jgi:hypothetical protein
MPEKNSACRHEKPGRSYLSSEERQWLFRRTGLSLSPVIFSWKIRVDCETGFVYTSLCSQRSPVAQSAERVAVNHAGGVIGGSNPLLQMIFVSQCSPVAQSAERVAVNH